MKTLFTTILFIGFVLSVSAQSISKQVVATAGDTKINATHQVTSTIGEPIIGLKSTTVSIDQGFLAGANNSSLSVEELVIDQTVKIYPNPVKNLVHISIENNTKDVTVTIYDTTGKQVAIKKTSTAMQTLNLSHLTSGIYLVQLHFKETNILKSFKIIKN